MSQMSQMSHIRNLYRSLFRRSANIYLTKLRFAVGQIHNLDTGHVYLPGSKSGSERLLDWEAKCEQRCLRWFLCWSPLPGVCVVKRAMGSRPPTLRGHWTCLEQRRHRHHSHKQCCRRRYCIVSCRQHERSRPCFDRAPLTLGGWWSSRRGRWASAAPLVSRCAGKAQVCLDFVLLFCVQ